MLVLVSVLIDDLVEHCIISVKFEGGSWRNMGGHVIYIEKEEEGAKNSPLWNSRVVLLPLSYFSCFCNFAKLHLIIVELAYSRMCVCDELI